MPRWWRAVKTYKPGTLPDLGRPVADITAGLRHLHAVLDKYAAHNNLRCRHRTQNLRLSDYDDITTAAITDLTTAKFKMRIRRRRVLGGLICEYERAE